MGFAGSRCSSTYLALLDFQKAFDSVSHRTMVGLLYDLGLPPMLVGYIATVYSLTRLTLGDDWFTQGRGFFRVIPYPPFFLMLLSTTY